MNKKYIRIKFFAACAVLVLSCFMCNQSAMPRIEYALNDLFLKSGGTSTLDIVIVGIDDESIQALGRYPWDRSVHADLINTLSKGEPAAIGMDFLFTEPSEDDYLLEEAIRNSGRVVLASFADLKSPDTYVRFGGEIHSHVSNYRDVFSDGNYATGHINGLLSEWDSKMRTHIPYITDIATGDTYESFAIQLYKLYYERMNGYMPDIALPKDYAFRPHIRYVGEIHHVSYAQALDKDLIDPEYFRDRIVLVGVYTTGVEDSYLTPASGIEPMYGVEIHANIVNNLIFGESVFPVSDRFNTVLCFIFGGVTVFLFSRLNKMRYKTGVAVVFTLVLTFAAHIAFSHNYIIKIVYPVIAIGIMLVMEFVMAYVEEYVERQRITKAFGRYVAPQVLERIIKGGEASLKLEGAKKEISVMFVDIRGFTKMSEKMAPENVVAILNEYLSLATKAVFDNGGMLDKYIGDSVMALYNVPFELEDHCFMAIKTAVQMKEMADELYNDQLKKHNYGVRFGIGINAGGAVVGNVGSEIRLDYTAIGDVVNVASRLESNAEPGQILITSHMYEKVKDKVDAVPIGSLEVKNRVASVDTYEVLGLKKVQG